MTSISELPGTEAVQPWLRDVLNSVQQDGTSVYVNDRNRAFEWHSRERLPTLVSIMDVTKISTGLTGEVRLDFDGAASAPLVEPPTERGKVSNEILLIDFNNDRVPTSVASVQSETPPATIPCTHH